MTNQAIVQWTGRLRRGGNQSVAAFAERTLGRLRSEPGFAGFSQMIRPKEAELHWLMAFDDAASLKAFVDGNHTALFKDAQAIAELEPAFLSRRPVHYRVPHAARPKLMVQLAAMLSPKAAGRELVPEMAALIRSMQGIDSFCGLDWLLDPDFGTTQVLSYWSDPQGFKHYLDANPAELAGFLDGIAEKMMPLAPYMVIDEQAA